MIINCINSDAFSGAARGAAYASNDSIIPFHGHILCNHIHALKESEYYNPIVLRSSNRYEALLFNMANSDAAIIFSRKPSSRYSINAKRLARSKNIPFQIIHPYKCLHDRDYMSITRWLKTLNNMKIRLFVGGDTEIETPCVNYITWRAVYGIVLFSN